MNANRFLVMYVVNGEGLTHFFSGFSDAHFFAMYVCRKMGGTAQVYKWNDFGFYELVSKNEGRY